MTGRAALATLDTPPAELVALYGLNRHANLRLLRRLKPGDLAKSAFHPERQKDFTVAGVDRTMGGARREPPGAN